MVDRLKATGKADCNHESVYFGSGDYYIICENCGRQWVVRCTDSDEACADDGNHNICGEKRIKC